jgi:hypothetical protein
MVTTNVLGCNGLDTSLFVVGVMLDEGSRRVENQRSSALAFACGPDSPTKDVLEMAQRSKGLSTLSALAVAALALLGSRPSPASDPVVVTLSASEARLRADVGYLADDLREGRAPGTQGIDAAADYIAGVFRELGLKTAPGAEGYFQPFTIKGSSALAGDQDLAFDAKGVKLEAKSKTDFTPLALGVGAELKAPVAFAGYGITAKDKAAKLDYDDYAGIDVKGKAVLILRREPQQDDPKSPFDGKEVTPYSDLRSKATTAFEHGASAVILVNDERSAKTGDALLPFNYAGGDQSTTIPFLMITRELADKILEAGGAPKLAELEKGIDSDLKPRSKPLEGVTISAKYKIERKGLKAKNVIGVLEGSGPLADETIVIGGHYDHLGKGGLFSGSLAPLSGDIHNGADDNASGTSMVLEMARRLAKRSDPLPRRVVFMAFSGEEKGLLGSRHYVTKPLFPLDKTVFMVNFDMVGRLNAKDELTIMGTGTTPGAGELIDALGASAGFKIKKIAGISDGMGGSDHESFYPHKIPVLFVFTGTHTDYHRPSDDFDKINYKGMARIADLGELFLLDIARRPTRPEFSRATPRMAAAPHGGSPAPAPPATAGGEKDTARVSISAYLGTIPDYDGENKGVKLNGVSEGSPAEKGGLKGGDVVIGFAGKPVATIYDYTQYLSRQKPGDTVDIKVKRDGKEVVLKVTLGSRPRGN